MSAGRKEGRLPPVFCLVHADTRVNGSPFSGKSQEADAAWVGKIALLCAPKCAY
jgi:hypothetical protein